MRGNYFRAGSEVFVEDRSIGSFASIDAKFDRDNIANTCEIELPMYAIGNVPGIPIRERVRAALENAEIIPGARIRVECWYYNILELDQSFKRVVVFDGYIRQVISGFPAKLLCEDHAFVLRFGTTNRDWRSRTSLRSMIEYMCPISNEAFYEYRRQQGLSSPGAFPHLSFDQTNSADIHFALQIFKLISPYDALTRLASLFTLYGYVDTGGQVYFGIGVRDKAKATVELNTQLNVTGRDIVPQNGLFTNYKVVASALMADGSRYTYEYGEQQGVPERIFVPSNIQGVVQQTAKNVMARLRGNRNKGTITTKLYPVVNMYDFVHYTDTLAPELSGNYNVIGKRFTGGSGGFNQILTVTDEIFML